jgi:antitoxin component YwqK of YwqJK toxin-antitoxin module
MKKILSILLISILFFGCVNKRVPFADTSKQDELICYQGEVYTGIIFHEFDDGSLQVEFIVNDGKLDNSSNAAHREWFDNGQLMKSIGYENGIRDGESKTYYKNGQQTSFDFFVNGKTVISKLRRWYDDGRRDYGTEQLIIELETID